MNDTASPLDFRRRPAPAAAIGPDHNQPPERVDEAAAAAVDAAAAKATIDALIASTEEWMAKVPIIKDEAQATACQTARQQLADHWTALDEKRKARRAPHDKAITAIQTAFKSPLSRLKVCIDLLTSKRSAWLLVDQRRKDAERAEATRIAAEAQRKAEQLAEAARAKPDGPGAVTNQILANEAAADAERARKVAAAMPLRAQVKSDLGGNAVSLRTFWSATITDWDACFRHFHELVPEDDLEFEFPGQKRPVMSLRVELQRLANEQARLGRREDQVAGCWIFSEEK